MKTTFGYTADRKLETITTPDAATTTHSYDPTKGRLTDITLPTGVSHFDYFGASDTAAGQAPGKVKAITGPYGTDLAFRYLGHLPSATIWTGDVAGKVAWGYNNDFLPISETITDAVGTSAAIKFGYGDLDQFLTCASLNTCTPPSADALVVAHNGNGLLSQVDYGALTESYAYDNFGQLASKTAAYGSTTILQSVFDAPGWAVINRRDALGRITHRIETAEGTTTTYDYTYSFEGRLTDVVINNSPAEHYAYSTQNGNRIAGNGVTSAQVVYDSQDRLRQYGDYRYTYTNNGELKTKTHTPTSQVKTYTYDALGNLLSVATTGGSTISYAIDSMNRRVAKKRNNGTSTTVVAQWLYRDGLKPVAELDGSGNLISTFVYASNQNTPDFMVRDGKTYRILTDHVGSPRLVVNVANPSDVPFRATYTAFGEETIAGEADFLPFGFAGGLFDWETRLVRFGARDYDPAIGRWTSKDPIRFSGQQSNLYVYVQNDPVNSSDQTGLIPIVGDSPCDSCFKSANSRRALCEDSCERNRERPRPAACGGDDQRGPFSYKDCMDECKDIERRQIIECAKNKCFKFGDSAPAND